ncbi:hypothetical protein ST201phi2-1p044 [Pseudomonas phage 201phi2-1]|uniref:Uncharacterized protein n=1 Tax=Pseudomonas phage 201phi2-1 TaxID=198110 RepID=B3FK19_BP201|nr:hypothetical protein ST201phi2-1p044 [Pseudomonas phage 201phi2-1]ABY62877.1 hypothetical protein 201phi2-1p044 [Pseudomonas phage 201phi2-1]
MNYFLSPDRRMCQEDEFLQVLRNSLELIGVGVAANYIEVSRTAEGLVFTLGARQVTFYQPVDDDNFWLKLTRGTKGRTDTHFEDKEHIDAVNITLNWLIHQEFSIDNHIELTARLAKEANKYAE